MGLEAEGGGGGDAEGGAGGGSGPPAPAGDGDDADDDVLWLVDGFLESQSEAVTATDIDDSDNPLAAPDHSALTPASSATTGTSSSASSDSKFQRGWMGVSVAPAGRVGCIVAP